MNLGYSDPRKTLSVPLIHPTHSMEALTSLLFCLSGCKMPSSILLLYVPRLGNINKWTSLAFTHSPVLSLHPAEERIMSMDFSTSLELRMPELQHQLSSNLLTQSFWKDLWVTQTLIRKLLWNTWGLFCDDIVRKKWDTVRSEGERSPSPMAFYERKMQPWIHIWSSGWETWGKVALN